MCQHCVAHVKKALEGIEGVEEAVVDLDSNSATAKLSACLLYTSCKRHRRPHNAHARFLPSRIRADRVHPKRRAPPPARDRAGGVVHYAGEIPRLTLTAGGRSRVLFSQSQFKGREGKSPCRARQSSCKGADGASWCGGCVFAAAAKTAAWHRLPGNRLGPVPLLSRNRLVADKNRRYVRSCIRKTLC